MYWKRLVLVLALHRAELITLILTLIDSASSPRHTCTFMPYFVVAESGHKLILYHQAPPPPPRATSLPLQDGRFSTTGHEKADAVSCLSSSSPSLTSRSIHTCIQRYPSPSPHTTIRRPISWSYHRHKKVALPFLPYFPRLSGGTNQDEDYRMHYSRKILLRLGNASRHPRGSKEEND